MDITFLPTSVNICFGLAVIAILLWCLAKYIKTKDVKITWDNVAEFCSDKWNYFNSNVLVLRWRYVVALLFCLVATYMVYEQSIWFALITLFVAYMCTGFWSCDYSNLSTADYLVGFIGFSFLVNWIALLVILIFQFVPENFTVKVNFLLVTVKGWTNLGIISVIGILGFLICPDIDQYDEGLRKHRKHR